MRQPAQDTCPNVSDSDLASLQGAWEQIALEADGVVDPVDTHGAPGALTVISGHHFEVRTIEGRLLLEGTFALDATTEPRSITWTDAIGEDKGKRLPASYRLEGDHFVFIAAHEGARRPQAFRTEAGLTMRTFVRKPQSDRQGLLVPP